MTQTTEPAGRPYGGQSATERRLSRRNRLTEAVLDLVYESGIESLSVGAICERASVSKRHLYLSFSNLDDLTEETLTDVLAHVADRIAAASAELDSDAPRARLIEGAVEEILTAFDDPRVARLYLEAPGNRGLRAARDHAVAHFVTQLLTLLAGDRADDPRAQLIARVLVGGTTEGVALWLRGDVTLERTELVATLTALGVDAVNHILRLKPPH
ncbi:TetR/AcrR family transcriptional regulator [Gordonia insulae]|uniref:HTH-type transcriptional regulator BetI n=1 Tax=Gordonia insulae TaxID=2420509 RepID=A0A3G8JGT4_9ACTN|nr:TetR family transcriptional regulator [Gordonia insulae]AZG43815.1 HTH-type transcriptional regulator BetI [Gordonia insulae]